MVLETYLQSLSTNTLILIAVGIIVMLSGGRLGDYIKFLVGYVVLTIVLGCLGIYLPSIGAILDWVRTMIYK